MTLNPRDVELPFWYSSLMSADEKINVAQRVSAKVTDKGLNPVAVSVTGSRLRGLDHEQSDTDVLVLVSDKLLKAKTVSSFNGLANTEAQIQSLDMFLPRLSSSLPYMEFWRSPFLSAEGWVHSLFDALRPNLTEFAFHAQRFALHVAGRRGIAQSPDKRARNVMAAYSMSQSLNPLCDRREFVCGGSHALAAAEWLHETAKGSMNNNVAEVLDVLLRRTEL